jgi:NAD(P)H-flavin reductase
MRTTIRDNIFSGKAETQIVFSPYGTEKLLSRSLIPLAARLPFKRSQKARSSDGRGCFRHTAGSSTPGPWTRCEPQHSMSPPAVPRLFRVGRVRRELNDTMTLELKAETGSELPAYRPGQFNMVYAFGIGEAPISMSGDASRPSTLVHTIRSVGAITSALCKLKRGDAVGLRGPYGSSWPLDECRNHDVMIVAGGIGIAPLRGAVYAIGSNRGAYGRVSVLIGARTPQEFLYSGEFETRRQKFNIDVQSTVDAAATGWTGHVGFVTALVSRASLDPVRTIAMICGPEIMMKRTAGELNRRHVPLGNVYISMERNMKCALGFCGHCQFGPTFICKDGPVFQYSRLEHFLNIREV